MLVSDGQEKETIQQQEWYSNKQLFEMIQNMTVDFSKKIQVMTLDFAQQTGGLKSELEETRRIIREYNGLRKSLNEVCDKVGAMEEKGHGKKELGENIRNWGGWIIALIMFILSVISWVANYPK
jgi:hypothetical protein